MIKRVGQLSGEFTGDINLIELIRQKQNIEDNNNSSVCFLKLGIQTTYKNIIKIDDKEFQIGRTGKLEFDNINIMNSEMFINPNSSQEEKSFIIIDFIYTME